VGATLSDRLATFLMPVRELGPEIGPPAGACFLGEHRILVSAVTYAEVLSGARLGHHDEEAVGGFFAELISAILPVDVAVADRAADLCSRFRSLRMPDALILASADTEASVELIVTGDQQIAKVTGLSCTVRRLG
jgi:predicted nucleic acid-binding protein